MVDRFERGMAHRRQLVAEAVTAKKAREAAAQEQPAWLEPARVTSTSSQNPQPDRKSIDVEVDDALRAALGTLQQMTERADRKSGGQGKSVSVRVDLGGRRNHQ